ncbi:AcrR family transcriptional regulator [Virgibacillus halotolerans]|uniref:TetR/AcrR family transcriptional regulator n=1 Tax=Virgibacillus halotolerans TaxID=1071053 RepID=UPI00195FC964|nr:TetR/AcrR family transcriptional regulator [Virgibacillus halotolerans]MBM7599575.1 AcrR family transcriptional regulator [Virgibacillus halotolerans]
MNDRKRQVLLTAQRLFVEKGFSATSVQDILEESKISKGTFYNYFSSKNECLLAILERIKVETSVRRRELLIGRSASSKDILAEQISIHMQVSQEQNLLPLFEAIFHSGDPELRAFVTKQFKEELSWLSGRIIDIYGEEVTPFAADCTVLLLGMLQHMTHIWMLLSKGQVDHEKLVHFIIRRMDSIINGMIGTDDIFIGGEILFNIDQAKSEKTYSKEQLLFQLDGFQKHLEGETKPEEKQYIQFLMDELREARPRTFLLETITHSFNNTFTATPHEAEAQEIASKLWYYADTIK